jgi:predicted dehydrogenase
MAQRNSSVGGANRREFLKTSSTHVVAGALASSLLVPRAVHAASDETLRVGLIGCGGRGSGAAVQALTADANVKLVAMGDAFADRLQSSLDNLKKQGEIAAKIDVPTERQFVGFNAYQDVLSSGVDVVLLATPPHFRPMHLKAAVDAGKHVFCEKPVAVDAPGVRSVIETAKQAEQKGLSIVSGLCWRYDNGVRETIQRIRDGAIGDIVAIQENYNAGSLWMHPRKPEWSDMEWQMRNWLYFTWLSGDHNVEQHVHSLDKAAWLLGDVPPLKATGLGGRQVRTGPEYGHIFDHHAVVYEFPGDVRVFAYCRQQDGCSNDVEDYVMGTKGRAEILRNSISGESKWRFRGPKNNMYQTEHDELFAAIRSGKPINNGHYMANSTMIAIMGRMATYTGRTVTWQEAIGSQETLAPPAYDWIPLAVPPVAMPGQTPLV